MKNDFLQKYMYRRHRGPLPRNWPWYKHYNQVPENYYEVLDPTNKKRLGFVGVTTRGGARRKGCCNQLISRMAEYGLTNPRIGRLSGLVVQDTNLSNHIAADFISAVFNANEMDFIIDNTIATISDRPFYQLKKLLDISNATLLPIGADFSVRRRELIFNASRNRLGNNSKTFNVNNLKELPQGKGTMSLMWANSKTVPEGFTWSARKGTEAIRSDIRNMGSLPPTAHRAHRSKFMELKRKSWHVWGMKQTRK